MNNTEMWRFGLFFIDKLLPKTSGIATATPSINSHFPHSLGDDDWFVKSRAYFHSKVGN
jgi:hypothetical protein